MTELLMKALGRVLEDNTKGLLAAKGGHDSLQPLKVYENYIPSDDSDEEAYPCLVIRWIESEDSEEFGVDVMDILVCTYSEPGREISESWGSVIAGRVRSILRENKFIGKNENTGSFKFKRTGSVRAINPKLNPDAKHFKYHSLTIRSQWQYMLPDTTVSTEA